MSVTQGYIIFPCKFLTGFLLERNKFQLLCFFCQKSDIHNGLNAHQLEGSLRLADVFLLSFTLWTAILSVKREERNLLLKVIFYSSIYSGGKENDKLRYKMSLEGEITEISMH